MKGGGSGIAGTALSLPLPLADADAEEVVPAAFGATAFFDAADVLAFPVFFDLASACFANSR